MDIERIKELIEMAEKQPINADGSSDWWDMLPRVFYKDLPEEIKNNVEFPSVNDAKSVLIECYPVGTFDNLISDKELFDRLINEALRSARYTVHSTENVSLYGADLIEAWELITKHSEVISEVATFAEEIKAALPKLQNIIPHKHLIPNNKLANTLTKDIKDISDAGNFELLVSGQGKTEISTHCAISYEGENVKLSSRQPFTEYDRNVADAVTSLYEYGDAGHIITPATVYRAMVHATESETPSPQQIGAVTRSLDKMRFVRVQIDCSEELASRKLSLNGTQITGGKIDTYLLALDKLEVTAGGQKVSAYKVLKAPILYEYSRLTGQVINVAANLLDIRDKTGGKIANTERRIAIKGYLLRRIAVMQGKTKNRQSNVVLYEKIYNAASDEELSRKEQQKIREYVFEVLDYWKKQNFIKGYKETTQGKKKTGIEITI